jgi:hypothetical protein
MVNKWIAAAWLQKGAQKLNFLPRDLAHGPEVFGVDAAFMAAHFPSMVVWGPNTTELFPPKPHPLFGK